MRIETIRTLPGPNIYLYRPVLVARIELEKLTDKESHEFPGFVERLLDRVPGLCEHHCASGKPGGFVARLESGTYFGHIVEHVAIELATSVHASGNFGRTVYAGAPGRYDMIIEYRNEAAVRYLLPVAVELVHAVLDDSPYPVQEKLAEARRIMADTDLGPSTRSIVEAAERRGIPWMRLNEGSLIQLGQGIHRRLIQATISDRTSNIAVDIACDKALTKSLLHEAGIPVPHGILVRTWEEALDALPTLALPVAVKPFNANQGKGISLQLSATAQIRAAFELAKSFSSEIIIEEYLEGKDYRVLVINGKVVAASERMPAHVIGDGVHTIAQLIERENNNPLRGDGHEKPLTRIKLDPITRAHLTKAHRSLDDIPALGEQIQLRETANLSTGGTARDVTDEIHPDVARLCERAARIIGLDICGIDLILPDIRQPVPASGAGIIEVNAAPGIRMHQFPTVGKARDIGAAIVEMLYPATTTSRIPIISITGTNGKTTVTRMIGHVLSQAGLKVGMTTTEGIFIADHLTSRGDCAGLRSCRTVLADPLVEAAVLETARGGIIRCGLGYDWSDVGVLTNIQADHLGQDGLETMEDLFQVKSLVAERVREGGTLILNADDTRLAALPEHPRIRKLQRQIVYFSLADDNPVVQHHRRCCKQAYFLRDGWLIEACGQAEQRLIHECDLPITFGGAARFQTANVLAALAACRALAIPLQQIVDALLVFDSRCNHGRMNLYRVHNGYVIIDYAHNPGALEALAALTSSWSDRRVTGIFTAPGDRDNELVKQLGRLAARCFDRLIVREDEDLRGRRPGEIAELLMAAVRREDPDRECRLIPQDADALSTALQEMEDGEIIVCFYEKYTEPCLEILHRFGAEPVQTIEGNNLVATVETVARP